MSRHKLAFTDAEWQTLVALGNLPPALPGARGDVPTSDTEHMRAALHRLATLAADSGQATGPESLLLAEMLRQFAEPRVRGGGKPGRTVTATPALQEARRANVAKAREARKKKS